MQQDPAFEEDFHPSFADQKLLQHLSQPNGGATPRQDKRDKVANPSLRILSKQQQNV